MMDHNSNESINLRKVLLKNSIKNEDFEIKLPQLHLNEKTFLENYIPIVMKQTKDNNAINKLLEHNSIKLLLLYDFLKKAEEKIKQVSKERDIITNRLNSEYKSNLQAVYDVILISDELIITHYLIEWLCQINKISLSEKVSIEKKFNYSNCKTDVLIPDVLNGHNHSKSSIDKQLTTDYNAHLSTINYHIIQGDLKSAQEYCYKNNLHNIDISLSNSLPRHNFEFAPELKLEHYDLLPLFCRTKELSEALMNKTNKNPIGNPNWQLSLFSNWNFAKSKENPIIRKFRALLSGSLFEIVDNPHEELLFTLNSFYYSKILSHYNTLTILNYEWSPLFDTNYRNLNRDSNFDSLKNIINKIMYNTKKNMATDILLNVELYVISMFISESSSEFYSLFTNKLNHMKDILVSEELRVYLNTYYDNITNQEIKNHNSHNKIGNDRLKNEKIDLMFLIYSRTFFLSTVISYNMFSSKIEKLYNVANTSFPVKVFDSLLINFLDKSLSFNKHQSNSIFPPHELLYILGYCLELNTIKNKVVEISNLINPDEYENFSKELELIFHSLHKEIRLVLVDKGKFNYQSNNIITLDDSIKRSINDINEEDVENFKKVTKILSSNFNIKNDILLVLFKICSNYLTLNKNLEIELYLNEFKSFISYNNITINHWKALSDKEIKLDFSKNDQWIDFYSNLISFFEGFLITKDNILYVGFCLIECLQRGFHLIRYFKNNVTYYDDCISIFKLCFRIMHFITNSEACQFIFQSILEKDQYANFKICLGDWAYHLIKWSGYAYKVKEKKDEDEASLDKYFFSLFTNGNYCKNDLCGIKHNYELFNQLPHEKAIDLYSTIYDVSHINPTIIKQIINKKSIENLQSIVQDEIYYDI